MPGCGGCAAAAARRRAEAERRAAAQTAASSDEGSTQSFSLQLRNGQKFTFGSRLEAEAENVRRGYTGTVKPA